MRTRVAKDKQEHLKRTYFTTYNVNEFGWPIWLPCCSNPDNPRGCGAYYQHSLGCVSF